jgi:hypothetical protein
MKIEILISYRLRCVTCTYVADYLEKDDFLESLGNHLDSAVLHDIEVTTMVQRAK